MPHLRLEHTPNVRARVAPHDLFGRLHRILAEVAAADVRNCKSRAVELAPFLVGESHDDGFVHLDVRILAGRTQPVKAELGRRLLEAVGEAYGSGAGSVQVTVEIHDIPRDHYFKL
jgi:5-carboxymethyl-2-hydroxymuconate isomerase